VICAWETLRAQVPVGLNTSLSGVPFWGTDIGGFYSTKELTGELYVRWFQFGAFCPLFRAHGRPSHTRFPWGWNTGEIGPPETDNPANLPDISELRNPQVEPICRKYLELRYKLMPYVYSTAREAHDTGMPMMRALWLHYPGDAKAAARGDEYLWGRDILVAPVTEKGARERVVYLPNGAWYDYWTGERVEGGREVARAVDLETMPLYVRAGAILPMSPPKQYTGERPDSPLTIAVYAGADGRFVLYEDDGISFDHKKGDFMRLRCEWSDARRRLTLALEPGSKMRPPAPRPVIVKLLPKDIERRLRFNGRTASVAFD
jgi:alpha-glucosidase/alpha-D-xyloside xylohydrolase